MAVAQVNAEQFIFFAFTYYRYEKYDTHRTGEENSKADGGDILLWEEAHS